MSEQDNLQDTDGSAEEGAKFALQRIYIKDASFESPKAPDCFRGQWQPKVNLELNSQHTTLETNLYEVVLQVTVTARNSEDDIVYIIEVQQAGIFLIQGLEGEPLSKTLGSFCSGVLFPYARESIDSLVIKGSFPALMLAPVNFDAIYAHAQQQKSETH
ncbi:MAG: protein-export chaperone SecB [bacterium]|nr:protein-export chaperone SecB [Gammaproteobacteria bacterium]HIL95346.1 protein-export chaperone SecB [Pseudomonadales bacterium]